MILVMYVILFVSGLVWLALVLSGVDQMSTFSVATPLAHIIIGLTTSIFALFALTACLLSQKNNESLAKLRQEQKGTWIASALIYTSCLALAFFWFAYRFVGAAAQHLSGATHESAAMVTKVRVAQSLRAACVEEISVELLPAVEAVTFCVESRHGKRIAPDNLKLQEKVLLRVRETRLGVLVEEVKRVDAAL
jgi:hypothetical protein